MFYLRTRQTLVVKNPATTPLMIAAANINISSITFLGSNSKAKIVTEYPIMPVKLVAIIIAIINLFKLISLSAIFTLKPNIRISINIPYINAIIKLNGAKDGRHNVVKSPPIKATPVPPNLEIYRVPKASIMACTTKNILSIGVGRIIFERKTITPKSEISAKR